MTNLLAPYEEVCRENGLEGREWELVRLASQASGTIPERIQAAVEQMKRVVG